MLVDRRTFQQVDAASDEVLLELVRNLGVLVGQHVLPTDDQGHFGAERSEHVNELDAGDSRTDHGEVLGDLVAADTPRGS